MKDKATVLSPKGTLRVTDSAASLASGERNSTASSAREELARMRNIDVRTVDRDSLKEIRDVKIDDSLPREERIRDFIRQIGNPYCYKVDGFVVKISFAGKCSLEDAVKSCIMASL